MSKNHFLTFIDSTSVIRSFFINKIWTKPILAYVMTFASFPFDKYQSKFKEWKYQLLSRVTHTSPLVQLNHWKRKLGDLSLLPMWYVISNESVNHNLMRRWIEKLKVVFVIFDISIKINSSFVLLKMLILNWHIGFLLVSLDFVTTLHGNASVLIRAYWSVYSD